ncbi:MAG TPA: HAD hydrolase-like protein [Gemmatimonadaceae bacterium]
MTMTGMLGPESIATSDASVGIAERVPDSPSTPIRDESWFASPRLRYIGQTQTSVAKRVRPHERRTVVLGLEGVLVDTREPASLSWLVALHDCGYNVALDMLRQLSGMSGGELLRVAVGIRANSPSGREILARQEHNFRTWYLPRILPFVGARRLVQRMKADGLRLVALSSGSSEMAPHLLRSSGVAGLLDDVVAADGDATDVVLSEIIRATLGRTGGSRDSIVLLGDCPYDVVAGRRSGIDVVALRCGGWADSSLEGAVAVYHDHLHLLNQYPRSPFGTQGMGSAPQLKLARVQ